MTILICQTATLYAVTFVICHDIFESRKFDIAHPSCVWDNIYQPFWYKSIIRSDMSTFVKRQSSQCPLWPAAQCVQSRNGLPRILAIYVASWIAIGWNEKFYQISPNYKFQEWAKIGSPYSVADAKPRRLVLGGNPVSILNYWTTCIWRWCVKNSRHFQILNSRCCMHNN